MSTVRPCQITEEIQPLLFDNPGQQLAVPGIRAGCLDGLLDVGELFGIGRDEGQDGGFKLAVVVSSEIR